MGREIRRVPLDFDQPMNEIWPGFLNPFWDLCSKCIDCGGSGSNPESKRVQDEWYDFNNTGRRWCNAITQDEVEALVEAGRLMDFTHVWRTGAGWVKIEPSATPTAAQVNAWSLSGIGHDAINEMICVKARCRRLGRLPLLPRRRRNLEVYNVEEARRNH